jgi:tRNA/tmRNA/rRNA uracil-C5-methylase (TrmA/RlmC/RlmD family)
MNQGYTIGDVLDVQIEKIVPRGLGLAFVEGLTVFVPLSVPGDRLRVRIREIKKRSAFAEIVEVVEPGAERIEPPCPYFGRCGGCDFQQMSYAAQLEAKLTIIRDCLHRIAKLEYDAEIAVIPSPRQLGYRSRARWHFDRNKNAFGYFARDSHEVIDIAACPILTPELEAGFENIRQRFGENENEIEAAAGDAGEISFLSRQADNRAAELSFTVNAGSYLYSAETFFQANKFLLSELIDIATGDAHGNLAFDLYCGVGLFTLPLARRFENVIAVEEHRAAVRFAKKNVANAQLDNVKIVDKSVERFLAHHSGQTSDFILIDPPRAGAEKNVIASIAALKPTQISYVSCEPSILARDLRIFLDSGYEIEKITALDMFPQTHHVETVVRMNRHRFS